MKTWIYIDGTFKDAHAEIERLRGVLAWTERERDSLRAALKNLAGYVAEISFTDAERRLIGCAVDDWQENAERWRDNDGSVADESERNAATLRGLLERTKND